jgi:hypothetical protein
MKTYRYVIAGALVVTVCIVSWMYSAKHARDIAYHRQKLETLAAELLEVTGGQRTDVQRLLAIQSSVEQEQKALVKLGYFVETDLPLSRRYLTPETLNEFSAMFRHTSFSNRFGTFTISDMSKDGYFTNRAIHVIAFTGDVPKWRELVANFDSGGNR